MTTISREILAHKVWNKTATPEELELYAGTRARPKATIRNSPYRRIMLGVMVNAARPAAPVVLAFESESQGNSFARLTKEVDRIKRSMTGAGRG